MIRIGSRAQQQRDDYAEYSGTITTGGTAQLLLPQRKSCSHLIITNNSIGQLMVQFGVRRGIATLVSGVVTSISVPDVGFGFQLPPVVTLLGGGNSNDPASKGGTMPDWPPPVSPAQAHAVMTTSAIAGNQISSIAVDFGGVGYLAAPYVSIVADRVDPTGVGLASGTAGIWLTAAGGQQIWNGTACPTSAISIWGATTGQAFDVKWMA